MMMRGTVLVVLVPVLEAGLPQHHKAMPLGWLSSGLGGCSGKMRGRLALA